MQKKELLVLGLCAFIFGLSMNAQAATNPDLVALSRAKVMEFTGTEHISQPFAFDLEVTVPNPALNFSNIVGQSLKLTVAKGRTIAGMVENMEQFGATR
jgi:uncharacterized protein involved in type VI secretion and phage assembly